MRQVRQKEETMDWSDIIASIFAVVAINALGYVFKGNGTQKRPLKRGKKK